MPARSIILASRNPGKLAELKQVLGPMGFSIMGLDGLGHIPEPEENGLTFAENARLKALYYAEATGQWCLADDSGLAVDALGGAPGVRSARYAADRCPSGATRKDIDSANRQKLLETLRDVGDEKLTARFVCHLALADAGKIIIEACDTVEGVICRREKGNNGFGYDPVFFLPQRGLTMAQLPPEQKNLISHRGKALRKLAEMLKKTAISS
ncbi:MAG: RdgB/HAM1 family non-canonical purine NTP pyrophosphatase [Planctomycetes bacterium]|nr:RdgB/HAM1 family non-canonical purine NTP pyrophosphatase [Planctomycetota bacterium]